MATLIFPHDGGEAVWNFYNTPGNSGSGTLKPKKLFIQELTTFYEETLQDHEDRIIDLEATPPGSEDGNAAINRVTKAALQNFFVGGYGHNVRPLSMATAGPGGGTMTMTPLQLWRSLYGTTLNDDMAWVDPNDGNDSTGTGKIGAPYLTFSKAFRDSAASNVMLMPGVYEPVSLIKGTHTGAAFGKRIRAPWGGVTFEYSGAGLNPTTGTWAITAGTSNLVSEFNCSALAATQFPTRVLRMTRGDGFSYPVRFQKYASVAELVALGAGGTGWYYDSAVEKLYVNYLGQDINAGAKAQLKVLFTDSAGNARLYIEGARVFFEGDFNFLGVGLEAADDTALTDSTLMLDGGAFGCSIFATDQTGIRVQGGLLYAANVTIHASSLDGINGNPSSDNVEALILAHNVKCTMSGDTSTFGTALATNRQGISCHGGCNIIAMGCLCASNWGQNIADTDEVGFASYSMYFGTVTQNSPIPLGIGFSFAGITSGSRTAYLDTCQTFGEDLSLEVGGAHATAYTFNCTFNAGESASSGGTITAYTDTENPP